ncbi:MAG: bifunctional demethylmenaquinone methyltransferase/2-methoxy-6-polyprenyl-1,4-benzoquinol methylase UbiE [Chlamydiales bacterium]
MSLYDKGNPETIQSMFGKIASDYDRANAILSFNFHKFWNRALVKSVKFDLDAPYLDLCAGTGDIAQEYLKKNPSKRHAILLDFSGEMLELAKQKLSQEYFHHHHITFLKADAQDIPLESNTIGGATIAYGIRNIKNPLQCFLEVHRVLKSKAPLSILELTRPQSKLLRLGHRAYLKYFLPLIGKWVTSDKEAYQYLCSSIEQFSSPLLIKQSLEDAGFTRIKITPLMGGIATILSAYKP